MRNSRYQVILITVMMTAMLFSALVAFSTIDKVLAGKGGREYNNQATSQGSDCRNGSVPTNVLCQNSGSQIQGDNNIAIITGEQQSPATGILIVKKVVQCLAGAQCPTLPDPDSGFIVTFFSPSTGNNFDVEASEKGTPIRLEPQSYQAAFEEIPSLPPGIELVIGVGDPGCSGSIQAGRVITCTVTNLFRPIESG